jgi:type IV secretory pathway TraG/TraD family ATPase VirD4
MEASVRGTSPLAGGLVLLVALLLIRAALAPEMPIGLWLLLAPAVGGLVWLALVVVAGGAGTIARPRRSPATAPAARPTGAAASTPGEALRAETARLGGGAYIGTSGGGWITADPESAVMVLGPPRSSKTTAVVIPAVMSATGPVVSTSIKPDVMRATAEVRSEVGQVWLFDPAGSYVGEVAEGVRKLSWSPVAAAASWDDAQIMARAMTRAAHPGAGTTDETHWSERAGALVAPLLHAAALSGRPIADVVRWVLRHDLGPAREILSAADAEIAADVLGGIGATDSRERSSIFSACASVLAAYNSDAVLQSAADPNFDAARFAGSTDTIYVTAPEERQAMCAPLVVGLLEQIRHAVFERAACEGEGPQMLWALDECANIAPIADLPGLVSQAGGQGLQLLVGLQDMSQARTRWGGEVADGFLTLFQTRVILSGLGDDRTLEAISSMLGEYDRSVVSRTAGRTETDDWLHRSPDQFNESVGWQTERRRVLGPGDIAALPVGQGLLLRGASWGLVGLPRWFETAPWKEAGPDAPHPEGLIHQASDGTLVRSRAELVVLETLLGMGLEVRYEEPLRAPRNAGDHRLPDFTITHGGTTWFWEHLGMLDLPSYARAWERKREWYERHGFAGHLITSADDADGGLSVPEIEARAERRILRGEPRLGEPGFASV